MTTQQIKRNDPARQHLHDYFLVDPTTGKDVASFEQAMDAMSYAAVHGRGRVLVLDIIHPDGCDCNPIPGSPANDTGATR